MLIALGFSMIAVFMYLILTKRLTPTLALVLVPLTFALAVSGTRIGGPPEDGPTGRRRPRDRGTDRGRRRRLDHGLDQVLRPDRRTAVLRHHLLRHDDRRWALRPADQVRAEGGTQRPG